jgi:hypothetical protein
MFDVTSIKSIVPSVNTAIPGFRSCLETHLQFGIWAHFWRFAPKTGPGKRARKRVPYFAALRPGAIKTACPEKQARRL